MIEAVLAVMSLAVVALILTAKVQSDRIRDLETAIAPLLKYQCQKDYEVQKPKNRTMFS